MIESFGFLASQCQHFLYSRSVRDVPDHLCLGMRADMFLDFHPDSLQVEPHLLQHIYCNALAKFDQPEQKMLSSHIIVVEPVSFLAGERQHLLGTWSK